MISKVTQTARNWVGKLAAIFAVATAFAANGSVWYVKGDGNGSANYRSLITDGWSDAWIAELGDKDFSGGERVLNGRVDVGAGEYVPSGLGLIISFK